MNLESLSGLSSLDGDSTSLSVLLHDLFCKLQTSLKPVFAVDSAAVATPKANVMELKGTCIMGTFHLKSIRQQP